MTTARPTPMPPLHLIAALDDSGAVGLRDALPWSHPEDLKRFQALTEGHPVVMGRRTFEGLRKPLPRRPNVVLSRDEAWREQAQARFPGLVVLPDWDTVRAWVAQARPWRWFAIGGPAIWSLAMPQAERLHLTQVRGTHEADTHFPAWQPEAWQEVLRDERAGFVFRDLVPASLTWSDPDEGQRFDRRRAYVDLDGVVADFGRAAQARKMSPGDYKMVPGAYRHLHVVPGAYQGLAALEAAGWEVWIATKPPANNPHAASEKLLWLQERWPELRHRVTITFDKGTLGRPGDLLIDDRPHKANVDAFAGRFVPFGPGQDVPDWTTLIARLPAWRTVA